MTKPHFKFNLFSTFKFKFILIFFLIISVISAIISWRAISGMQDVAMSVFYTQGYNVIRKAQAKVDPSKFRHLSYSKDETDPYYQELHDELLKIKNDSTCRFLYTMVHVKDNDFMYIVDGSTTPDDEENFSPMGTVEDLTTYGDYPHRVLKEKDVLLSNIRDTDGWGKIITLYAPIMQGSDCVGFVACDFDAVEIYSLMQNSRNTIMTISLIMALIGLILIFIYISNFFRSLGTVTVRMNEIATGEGDLTARIPLKSKSELSNLSEACNNIIEKLQLMIREEKSAVTNLSKNSQDLINHNKENSVLIYNATNSIKEIFERAQNQTQMTAEATGTIEEFIEAVLKLDEQATAQLDAISSSGKAILQISNNIKDVSKQISDVSEEYSNIVIKSQDGKHKQAEVTQKVEVIQDLASKLFAANKVISEITAQTNLLAMNAAIEAAHAGSAGQGFSVVANEIRSLAENSAVQTKSIQELVQNVENAVVDIVEASKNSSASFDTLEASIKTMDSSLQTVNSKIAEQNEESEKIRMMMNVLQESSKSISSSSSDLRLKNSELEKDVSLLQEKASEILECSSSATDKLDQMRTFADKAEVHSKENLRLSDSVKKLVDSYKTE